MPILPAISLKLFDYPEGKKPLLFYSADALPPTTGVGHCEFVSAATDKNTSLPLFHHMQFLTNELFLKILRKLVMFKKKDREISQLKMVVAFQEKTH